MEILLPIQHFKAQQKIFNSKARYIIVSKGRRFGMTRGAANDFIMCALEGSFKMGLWVDVINGNIERYVQRYFIPVLNKIPKAMWDWKKQDKVLRINNSIIDFRSADRPESIEGFGYDKAFLNEAGIILKNEYLWHNSIRPMLWEFKPKTIIGGTPKGKGLFHELYLRGEDPAQKLFTSLRFTTFDNPYLPADEIRKEIESLPDSVVKQEIYGEFLDDGGVVFRRVSECMTATPQKPLPSHEYVMGVDLAKVQDYTVISVFDRGNNSQVYQDRFNNLDWNMQKKKIVEISRHYNDALVIVDATGVGDPVAEDIALSGVPVEAFKFTNDSKKELIEKMMIWIEQRKVRLLPIKESIVEFDSFTYDVSSTGRIKYSAPVGFHDDIICSIGMAIRGLTELDKTPTMVQPSIIREEIERRMKGHSNDTEYEDFDDEID